MTISDCIDSKLLILGIVFSDFMALASKLRLDGFPATAKVCDADF